MSVIFCRKQAGVLWPLDEGGQEVFNHIAEGEMVTVDIRRPRNVQFHRLFFALLQIVFENQSRCKSIDELLDVVKISVGHCRTFRYKDGTEVKTPKSISFSRMKEDDFRIFYDRVVAFVCQELLPRMDSDDLKMRVLEIIG